MLLADAIEQWGQEHRDSMDADQRHVLADIWTTVKNSDLDDIHIEAMSKDQGRQVMALFDPDKRANAGQWLNVVRKWALSLAPAAAADPFADETAAAAAEPARQPAAAAVQDTLATEQPVTETAQQVGAESSGGGVSTNKLLAGLAIAVVVMIGSYFAFFRDSSDSQVSTTTAAVTQASDDAPAAGAQSDTTQDDASQSGTAQDDATQGDPVAASGSDDAFCAVARQFEQQDPLTDVSVFDGKVFFDRLEQVWATVAAAASGTPIEGDIANLQRQFQEMAAIMAAANYDFTDPALGQAMAAFDTAGLDASSARIEAYAVSACGISLESSFGDTSSGGTGAVGDSGIDPDLLEDLSDADAAAIGAQMYAALGVSPELAECLNRELGGIDSAQADPALLTKPVCGTTLLEVISGIGQD